jgi:uncharacterized protein (TIGR02118 family)
VFRASVAYPLDADGFDLEYFSNSHAPMFARLLGDACVRFEVHRGLASPGAPPPPFAAAAYFWVTSAEAFGAAWAEHGPAIYAEIARFSRIQPVRGWSEVTVGS